MGVLGGGSSPSPGDTGVGGQIPTWFHGGDPTPVSGDSCPQHLPLLPLPGKWGSVLGGKGTLGGGPGGLGLLDWDLPPKKWGSLGGMLGPGPGEHLRARI